VASSEEPGICGGSAPAIIPHGVGGDGYDGWITGTQLYVADVIEALDRLGSEGDVARQLGLSEHQVRVAVEWYARRAAGS
jgi:uncharacterized protein (DUF433 family)